MKHFIHTRAFKMFLECLFIGLIIVATVWGYYLTLHDFFIMDDFDMIRGHSTFQQFFRHWHTPVGANSYRPLIDLLFIWDFAWWGWNPFGWHLSDLIFHVINALLVYVLTKRLLHSPYAALVAGMLFGLHTSHTEAVTWISARMDVVNATFFLLSLLAFITFTRTKGDNPTARKKRIRTYLLSLAWFACAVFVKEMGVTLPVVIVCYDLIFETQWNTFRYEIRKKLTLYAPYLLLLCFYFLLRFIALSGGPGYGSTLRQGIGGYHVELFGTFIFKNIVTYFKFLAIPFVDQVFSASLFLNLLGIGIITLLCLLFSKESRFAVLWIFITLSPVYAFTIGRGVYLASVGFCVLLGMMLTYAPTLPAVTSRFSVQRIGRMGLRTVQTVLILALFARYGLALRESNGWWSRIAKINEEVPLLVKALYPTFPKNAKICLQNVPVVANQRFNTAFQFRYPENVFAGIYTQDFEKCIQGDTSQTINTTYFFHYDTDTLYDVTPEVRAQYTSPYAIVTQRVSQLPQHILSAQTPHIEITLETQEPCVQIGLNSMLANGIEVPNGTLIARGRVEGSSGENVTFEVVAGVDTAEWAIRFPAIHDQVQHAAPETFRSWTVMQPDRTITIAQSYLKVIPLEPAFIPTKLSLEFVAAPTLPALLTLDINRILLYTENTIVSK